MNSDTNIGQMYVDVQARLDKYESDLRRIEGKNNEAATRMSNAFKRIGTAVFAGASAAATMNFLKGAVQESIEASKAMAKVEQVVRQTGGSAGYSAEQLKNMATSLESIVAVDADQILNDITLQLQTFGNVSGDVFERAHKSALDLSATLGSDLKSQSIQLGKALDDPLKGITALRKAGVMFSEVQMKNIEKLVKAGQLAKAQALILDEIDSKYGGQAKAQADATKGVQSATVAWGNMKEEVGNLFGPLLSSWLPEATKGIKGLTMLLNGTSSELGASSGKDVRKKFYYETIQQGKGESNEDFKKRIENEKTITKGKIDAQKKIADASLIGNSNGKSAPEYRTAMSMVQAYTEQLNVLKEIDKWKNPVKKTVVSTPLSDEEIKAQQELADKKKEALDKYYEAVKFYDKTYFDYRVGKIQEEAELQKKLLGKKFDSTKFIETEVAKVRDENNEFIYQREQEIKDKDLSKTLTYEQVKYQEKLRSMKGISEETIARLLLEKDFRMDIEREIEQQRINGTQEILNSVQQIQNQLGVSGDSFVSWLIRGLQVMMQIKNISNSLGKEGGSGAGGMLGIFSTVLGFIGMANGGTVTNIGGRITTAPQFADGASNFIVPSGYPNDSYPMFVQSGERVNVERAGSFSSINNTGNEAALIYKLNELIRVNRGMNANLILIGATRPEINANIDSLQFTSKEVNQSNAKLKRIGS